MADTLMQTRGETGYEDYISLLPDCLIHRIFSFLPTRDVVKTCILSKRWRSVWTTISDLSFSVCSYNDLFVDTVLTHYMWRKVEKFHLDIKQGCYHSNIVSWIHFAIDHQVEDLLLNLNYCLWYSWWGETLSTLLNNCSSLTKLCLSGCRFSSTGPMSWSSLKSLSIQNVSDEALWKILMGSPVLEHLNLIGCSTVKRIQSRSLRELVIDDCRADIPLEISTPCLLSLRVRSAYFCNSIRIIEAPSIVEAELDFGPSEYYCRLLVELIWKLQNVTRILFGACCFRVMLSSKVEDVLNSLPNCKSLTLHVPIGEFRFLAIANMLATTPNLEKLVVKFERPAYNISWLNSNLDSGNVDHESYWHIEKKLKHSARHLKNVEIFGFYTCSRFKGDELFMLAKFILEHASVLEHMVINTNHKSLQDLEVVDSRELLEVARRLQSYHRASQHVAVILFYLVEQHRRRHDRGDGVTTKCLCIGHKNAGLE